MLGRSRSIARRLGGGLILLMVLVIVPSLTASSALLATLSVTPTSGLGGTSARVEGSGFSPLLGDVRLCWDSEGCSSLGRVRAGDIGLLGNFTKAVTIPVDATAGGHLIYACQSDLQGCASTGFQVLATTTTAPPTTTIPPTTTAPTIPVTTTTQPTITAPTSATTTSLPLGETTTSTVPAVTTTAATTTTTTTELGGPPPMGNPPTSGGSVAVRDEIDDGVVPASGSGGGDPGGNLTSFQANTGEDGDVESPTPQTRRYTPPRPSSGVDNETAGNGGNGEDDGGVTVEAAPLAAAAQEPWLPEPFGFWLNWLLVVLALAGIILVGTGFASRRRSIH